MNIYRSQIVADNYNTFRNGLWGLVWQDNYQPWNGLYQLAVLGVWDRVASYAKSHIE